MALRATTSTEDALAADVVESNHLCSVFNGTSLAAEGPIARGDGTRRSKPNS